MTEILNPNGSEGNLNVDANGRLKIRLAPNDMAAMVKTPPSFPDPASDNGSFVRQTATMPALRTGTGSFSFTQAAVDTGTDVIALPLHGLAGDTGLMIHEAGITGLTEGVIYFVQVQDANSIGLSLTPGGALVNLTAAAEGTYTATEYLEDRINISCAVEDPDRDRILIMGHTRTCEAVPVRSCYLASAPWGHQDQVTRLTGATPFIGKGTGGDWDDVGVYHPHGCVVGNVLHIAYHGQGDTNGPLGIGLANFTLTGTESDGSAVTKLGRLNIGASPYNLFSPSLNHHDGKFHLLCRGYEDDNTTMSNPRYYYSPVFSATASFWTSHPAQFEYGASTTYGDLAIAYYPSGKPGRWWMVQVTNTPDLMHYFNSGWLDFERDEVMLTQTSRLLVRGSGEDQIDTPTPLYHNGVWYMYFTALPGVTGGFTPKLGKYVIGTQESQTGFTATKTRFLTKQFLNVTSSTLDGSGYIDINYTTASYFKKITAWTQASTSAGGMDIAFVALNKDKSGATANGKVQLGLKRHHHGSPLYDSAAEVTNVTDATASGTKAPWAYIEGQPY